MRLAVLLFHLQPRTTLVGRQYAILDRVIENLVHLKREEFDIVLYGRIHPFATDQSFRVEHRIFRIDG